MYATICCFFFTLLRFILPPTIPPSSPTPTLRVSVCICRGYVHRSARVYRMLLVLESQAFVSLQKWLLGKNWANCWALSLAPEKHHKVNKRKDVHSWTNSSEVIKLQKQRKSVIWIAKMSNRINICFSWKPKIVEWLTIVKKKKLFPGKIYFQEWKWNKNILKRRNNCLPVSNCLYFRDVVFYHAKGKPEGNQYSLSNTWVPGHEA